MTNQEIYDNPFSQKKFNTVVPKIVVKKCCNANLLLNLNIARNILTKPYIKNIIAGKHNELNIYIIQ